MNTQPEALRLAKQLESDYDLLLHLIKPAAAELRRLHEENTALRQAIAQAEKQQALDKKADNARELGLDYEQTHTDHPMRHWDRTCPACLAEKKEPVAWSVTWNNDSQKHQVTFNTQDEAMLWSARNLKIGVIKPLYTAPPRKEWVGLTDDEYDMCDEHETWRSMYNVAAKLKEKNGG